MLVKMTMLPKEFGMPIDLEEAVHVSTMYCEFQGQDNSLPKTKKSRAIARLSFPDMDNQVTPVWYGEKIRRPANQLQPEPTNRVRVHD